MWLDAVVAVGAGAPSAAPLLGGVGAALGVRVGPSPFAVEIGLREVVADAAPRSIGTIDIDLRWPADAGVHLLGGFAHHHETPLADARAYPMGSAFGTLPSITHRSGFGVGVGWDGLPPYTETAVLSRIRPTAELRVVVLPGTGDPLVYGVGEVGLLLALGPLPDQ